MIEACSLPTSSVVANLAVGKKTEFGMIGIGGVLIIFAVARKTFRGRSRITVGMAGITFRSPVCPLQLKCRGMPKINFPPACCPELMAFVAAGTKLCQLVIRIEGSAEIG